MAWRVREDEEGSGDGDGEMMLGFWQSWVLGRGSESVTGEESM